MGFSREWEKIWPDRLRYINTHLELVVVLFLLSRMVCFFSALGILWAVYVHLEWHCSSSRWEEQDQWCRGVSPFLIDTNCYSITQNLDYPDWLVAFEWRNQCLKAPSLWGYGGPTVGVRYSAFFFFNSCITAGSLPLQTMVNTCWCFQLLLFLKPVLKVM